MTQEVVQPLPSEATVKAGSPVQEVQSRLNRRNFGWLLLATLGAVAGGTAVVDALAGEGDETIAGSGTQAQATDGFPECNFAQGGFVETDQQGTMYQCLDGKWKRVGEDSIYEEQYLYINVNRELNLDVGGVHIAHGEVKFERFIPGDVEASAAIGVGQGRIEQGLIWDQNKRELQNGGTFWRDLFGNVLVNLK